MANFRFLENFRFLTLYNLSMKMYVATQLDYGSAVLFSGFVIILILNLPVAGRGL